MQNENYSKNKYFVLIIKLNVFEKTNIVREKLFLHRYDRKIKVMINHIFKL